MGKEIEIQVLEVNQPEIERKLKQMGVTCVMPMRRMVRAVYHTCNGANRKVESFARVRDEGAGTTTLTVKVYNDPKYPDEYEIATLNSFDEARALMLALNIPEKSYQETYRKKWGGSELAKHGIHEVTFDMIPGLPMYMEVEAESEAKLYSFLELLGTDSSKQRTGAFGSKYYEYYGIPESKMNNGTPVIDFTSTEENIIPVKNHKLFKDTLVEQRRIIKTLTTGKHQTLNIKTNIKTNTKTKKASLK